MLRLQGADQAVIGNVGKHVPLLESEVDGERQFRATLEAVEVRCHTQEVVGISPKRSDSARFERGAFRLSCLQIN